MRFGQQTFTIALLFALSGVAGFAATRLDDWLTVPPRESGLVVIINAPIDSVSFFADKETLETVKWDRKTPTFIRQIRLDPGDYEIRLQGPIPSISVTAKQGTLSYLRLGRYEAPKDSNESGAYVVAVSGTPREVPSALEIAAKSGIPDVYNTSFFKLKNNVIVVNTEPPWPIPPQPPPKR
jgi:hypothetical protein